MAIAKRLRRLNPKTSERLSVRKIGEELAALGHVNANGRPFACQSVRSMLGLG